MQLNNYLSRNDLLIDWIFECADDKSVALDIGANDSTFCPEVKRIHRRFRRLDGVDPDAQKLMRNPFVSNRYCSTLEEANIEPETYDLLYSFYVLEHVLDPQRFLAAASRCLKPGGSLFFITPNGNNYFAFLASMLATINMQHRILRLLRPSELVDSYHYPAVYKLNRPNEIEKLGRAAGFDTFEFRYSERLDEVTGYFPGVTKAFPRLWENVAARSGREDLLLNLMGRIVKKRA